MEVYLAITPEITEEQYAAARNALRRGGVKVRILRIPHRGVSVRELMDEVLTAKTLTGSSANRNQPVTVAAANFHGFVVSEAYWLNTAHNVFDLTDMFPNVTDVRYVCRANGALEMV